jgi:hypothetical protein
MPINRDSLRTELQESEKKLQGVRKRRMQAEEEEKRILEECQAYRVLLGTYSTDEVDAPESDPSDSSDSSSSEGTLSKRAMIRQALSNAGTRGIAPAAIYKALKSKGVTRTYVHSTLFKMKESGQAKESEGKYSAVPVQ